MQSGRRMRRILFVVIGMAFANTAAAEDSTQEAPAPEWADGRWDLTVAAGVTSSASTTSAMPGMQLMPSAQARTVDGSMTTDDTWSPSSGLFSMRYGLRDRVLWSVPTLSFAYLGGDDGDRQWIPWGGLTSWGLGYSSISHLIAQGELGTGIGVRQWLGHDVALNATTGVTSHFLYVSKAACDVGDTMCDNWSSPEKLRGSVTAGASLRVGDAWTFNAGVGTSTRLIADSGERASTVSFGSIQAIGLRVLPLVEARVNARWSIDGYATAAYEIARNRYEQTYLLGVTRIWFP
jgi:opacity protein-like surface antigen